MVLNDEKVIYRGFISESDDAIASVRGELQKFDDGNDKEYLYSTVDVSLSEGGNSFSRYYAFSQSDEDLEETVAKAQQELEKIRFAISSAMDEINDVYLEMTQDEGDA